MAQIHDAGIKINLWTYNKFLSRRPIKNAYAAIETPETAGLISANPEQLQDNLRPVFELGNR
jgi:hypothetical protein